MRCTTVLLGDSSRLRATVVLNPYVQVLLYVRECNHVVASAVGVDDRYGAHAGLGRGTAHGIAADGSKGSYAVGYFVHGVICKHAAHRESRQIHTSAVDVVLVNHLVDDSQHEVDVAIAVQVPTLTDTLGKHGDELGCIGHRLDVEHVHLVGGVLVHTVARYEQRSLFAQVLGYILYSRSVPPTLIFCCAADGSRKQKAISTDASNCFFIY